MRHLHGAFEQTIFCQVARELQLFANGKRRSGPHANSRLTQVNHGAGDCPPASPELAVPLDDQPDGLPLVAHALTLLSLTKLSKESESMSYKRQTIRLVIERHGELR